MADRFYYCHPLSDYISETGIVPDVYTYAGHDADTSNGYHKVDIGCPSGTKVHAMADGIIKTDQKETYIDGNSYLYLEVTPPNCGYAKYISPLYIRYMHMRSQFFSAGTQVKKGQIIGESGGAAGDWGRGTSSGPHLHIDFSDNMEGGSRLHLVQGDDLMGYCSTGGEYSEKNFPTIDGSGPFPDQGNYPFMLFDQDVMSIQAQSSISVNGVYNPKASLSIPWKTTAELDSDNSLMAENIKASIGVVNFEVANMTTGGATENVDGYTALLEAYARCLRNRALGGSGGTRDGNGNLNLTNLWNAASDWGGLSDYSSAMDCYNDYKTLSSSSTIFPTGAISQFVLDTLNGIDHFYIETALDQHICGATYIHGGTKQDLYTLAGFGGGETWYRNNSGACFAEIPNLSRNRVALAPWDFPGWLNNNYKPKL